MSNLSDSFNPANYQSQSYDDMSVSSEEESLPKEVEKGHKKVLKVDVGKFEDLCKRFREKKDIKIKKLSGKDKEEFNLVVSYVHLLYGTEYYKHIHQKVKKYFNDVQEVNPGTVGGYFAGCLVNTDYMKKPGCSVACAGAIPLPKDEEGWSFCDKAVVLADKKGKGYSFNMVKPAETDDELDDAYIFVEHKTLHDFYGFCQTEKDELKSMGFKKVHLIGYGEDGTSYSDFYGESKRLIDIKHRKRKNKKKNNNLSLALLLLVVFLILIALFFGWRFWNDQNIQ